MHQKRQDSNLWKLDQRRIGLSRDAQAAHARAVLHELHSDTIASQGARGLGGMWSVSHDVHDEKRTSISMGRDSGSGDRDSTMHSIGIIEQIT